MELSNISLNLKQSLQQNDSETLDLSPGEIAGFLEICRQALCDYVCYANAQLDSDSEAFLPVTEIEKIDSVFRELTNNFFPMAHSNEQLRRLQIVDKTEYRNVMEGLSHLARVGEDARELSEHLSQSIGRLINP
jgi:hypothetical protein